MDWQQIVSLVIVAGAGAALSGAWLRRRKLGIACAPDCGCSAAGPAAIQNSIVFHARKSGRPR